MEARTAQVIPLRPPRSCFDCSNFDEIDDEEDPASGVLSDCRTYQELIDSETYDADGCPAYEVSA